jgi:hypothetical protein
MRPPVLREGDDRPLAKAPKPTEYSGSVYTLDAALFGPISRSLDVDVAGEATNVNAQDEVPDSTWFTNRTPPSSEIARGACADVQPPALPLRVKRAKEGGVTPGFFVEDAHGKKWLVKSDELAPWGQPEMSTAADAIVSRLYWALGYNTPCNFVIDVDRASIVLDPKATEKLETGKTRPFTEARLSSFLSHATRAPSGALRLGASRLISGQSLGPWHAEGTRADDPNDVVPHEDRRELRGERFLAAWVAHWDSRDANTFDAFGADRHVVHYFLDFSDALGGTTSNVWWREKRVSFESIGDVGTIAADALGFGFVRRPWDDVRVDPHYPNLGTFEVEHFEPLGFRSMLPLVRWSRAKTGDFAWMARKLARVREEDVRAAVRAGRLTSARESERLVEVLLARRTKILEDAFARSSPLADVVVSGSDVCATDLAIATNVSRAANVSYALELRDGTLEGLVARRDGARLCTTLRAHTGSYVVLSILRFEAGRKTILRVHFWHTGAGWFAAGIERP